MNNVFHTMGNNTFDTMGFPWIQQIVSGLRSQGSCRVCGAKREEPQAEVTVVLERRKGSKWPDVLGCGDYPLLVVSRRVTNAWTAEGIGQFPTAPVKFSGPMPNKLEHTSCPEYVWLDGRKMLGARLDFDASGFVGVSFCSDCGTRSENIGATYDRQHSGIWPYSTVVGTWNGANIFTTDLAPTVFFCSDSVIECARKYALTNFKFVPAERAASCLEGVNYMKTRTRGV